MTGVSASSSVSASAKRKRIGVPTRSSKSSRGRSRATLKASTSVFSPPSALDARQCSSCNVRSEEHTSELQSRLHLVCRLLLEKKKKKATQQFPPTGHF